MGESYRVTTVGMAPAEDRAKRMRFYYIAMGMRVACVASLFFLRGWWILVAVVGAVLLPYFAVMIANAVAANPDESVDAPEPLGISSAEPTEKPSSPAADAGSLIVVDAPGYDGSGYGCSGEENTSPEGSRGGAESDGAASDDAANDSAESNHAESDGSDR